MAMDAERLSRTRLAMEKAELDALACRLPENVLMLSGHWPLNGFSFLLFPLDGTPLLVLPHCDFNEARDEVWQAECVPFQFGVLTAGDPYAAVAEALRRSASGHNWMRVGIEAGFEAVAPPWNAAEPAIPAAPTRRMLEEVFGSGHLVDATDVLLELRARKTPLEQAALRRVNEIAAFGLAAFAEAVDVGASGVDLVTAVENAVMSKGTGYLGARRVRAFAQVSTGPEETAVGYRPMVISTKRRLEPGDTALLEMAVVCDGFWSDRTRPRVTGEPNERQRTAFETVHAAQEAAIAAVEPGATSATVDRAARSVIHAAGFSDEEFLHVTGHGLGFRYHEPIPLILPGGSEVLAEGMLHSVEPGIYAPDFGGIRIEDNLLVTTSGAEVLGPYDKSLG